MSKIKKEKYLNKIKKDGKYQQGIHPLQIMIYLDENGYDQPGLAAELGKSQAAISLVINRGSKSVSIRERISEILSKPFLEVWGMTEEETVSKIRK